ncbi:hypothetical protein C8R47DRAFT_1062488 [Mycena vitilis]|nr:hypothetical protein C8R47DRAFT_1062488 [Mycena vitilis]
MSAFVKAKSSGGKRTSALEGEGYCKIKHGDTQPRKVVEEPRALRAADRIISSSSRCGGTEAKKEEKDEVGTRSERRGSAERGGKVRKYREGEEGEICKRGGMNVGRKGRASRKSTVSTAVERQGKDEKTKTGWTGREGSRDRRTEGHAGMLRAAGNREKRDAGTGVGGEGVQGWTLRPTIGETWMKRNAYLNILCWPTRSRASVESGLVLGVHND